MDEEIANAFYDERALMLAHVAKVRESIAAEINAVRREVLQTRAMLQRLKAITKGQDAERALEDALQ